MAIKTYLLYCEICGYKKITDGSDVKDLIEVKRSPLMTGAPKLDPVTKKTVVPPTKKRRKAFKCPKCGRMVFPKIIQRTEHKTNDEESDDTGHQAGNAGREVQE